MPVNTCPLLVEGASDPGRELTCHAVVGTLGYPALRARKPWMERAQPQNSQPQNTLIPQNLKVWLPTIPGEEREHRCLKERLPCWDREITT